MNRSRIVLAALLVAGLVAGSAQAASLAVNGTAALGGTSNGLEVDTDVSPTVGAYVISLEPDGEDHFLVRFRLKVPTSFSMPQTGGGNYFRIMNFRRAINPAVVLVVFLKRSVGNGNYRINLWYRSDAAGFLNGGEFFFAQSTNQPDKLIEIEYTQGTGSGNGELNAKVNDAVQTGYPKTNLDNDDMPIDEVYMGFIYNAGDAATASLSGSYYMDEYESYR